MGRLRTNTKAPTLIQGFSQYCDLKNISFPKKNVFLEIGSGKGDFLIQQAQKNKNNFYIGIEKYSTVILKALKKMQRNNLVLNNLIFCCVDIKDIDIEKLKNKISGIYLNFSDPWPKKRHEKRRLTSPFFLKIYEQLLKENAIVEFKTDNDGLYQYSLATLQQNKNVKILYFTNDLYRDLDNKFNKNNIQSEYEKKFVALNKKIKKITWLFLK